MFCGWFSGVLWWMSPCQWISANLSNFEMILFSTWLYSSQTKLCSHLKLPCFGYLFFTLNHYLSPVSLQDSLQSLPVTSFSAGASSVGFPLYQASFWLSLLETPSEEPSSEGLGSSFIVISTQSTWIESRREYGFFFLERKQGEGTACKRITMFSPLFSCRFADSTGIPLPAAAALPWLPNGTYSESSKVGPHPLF